MIQQIDDLRAEAGELGGLLACLREDDWPRATLFKAWTVDDIVRHLHMGDTMALLVEYGGLDKATAGKAEDYYSNDYLP